MSTYKLDAQAPTWQMEIPGSTQLPEHRHLVATPEWYRPMSHLLFPCRCSKSPRSFTWHWANRIPLQVNLLNALSLMSDSSVQYSSHTVALSRTTTQVPITVWISSRISWRCPDLFEVSYLADMIKDPMRHLALLEQQLEARQNILG